MSEILIAIVPAAGIGTRARTDRQDSLPKQYKLLAGEPILRHSVRALLADPRILQVRVLVAPRDSWVQNALQGLPRTVWNFCGGHTRAETVASALFENTIADSDWILVHDAVRPGLATSTLTCLIDSCLSDSVGGLLALPIVDTVKFGQVHVTQTLNRECLWLAQTPQMFRAGLLRYAWNLVASFGKSEVTDESSMVEAAGYKPLLVAGTPTNLKVTWPGDIALLERWL